MHDNISLSTSLKKYPSGMAVDTRLLVGVHPDARAIRSSASTPSLRSRDGILASQRMDGPGGGNVRVVVRVREFLPREIEKGSKCLISMNAATQVTTLHVPDSSNTSALPHNTRKVITEKTFAFDNSFWSHNKKDSHYAHQSDVYNALGEDFLDHNFEGYHTCIFAYGQTGSGKSYTMMGTPDQPGLIPRTCEDLFERIEAAQIETPNISYNVRVSFFEVYNEHVRDLLVTPRANSGPFYLKIRESPSEGPYIVDLTDAPVRNIKDIMKYIKTGDRNRTVASTKMNDTSSRSHAVFTIMLKQIHHDMEKDETTERVARIRLVDLAGSERAKSTEATGARLREGSNINKSLSALGRVIASLADPRKNPSRKKGKDIVPYRDSILTWLLKDSLGGNSKTAMIACISPSDYDETLSTLRYANQAKRIRTRAIINQDHISAAERDAQIAAMAEEIRVLQLSISESRRREEEGVEKEDEVEKWQAKVSFMQRAMEEKDMVQSGKIRSLQTENEALRLHLKLLLDHHRNPIEIHGSQLESSCRPAEENAADPESHQTNDEKARFSGFVDGEIDDEPVDVSSHEEKADETRLYMQELLADLNMFKRKVFDDKKRFMHSKGRRVDPL
ncbi:unnamed protein product [Blumeria hordei]|uniref:Kinesin-like protein n=1 Tax=Blumeria hordei TaxID=2867405 RepID=A0A383URD8_BLUHO|nr:unnamed protein product [Blumeria hordei]